METTQTANREAAVAPYAGPRAAVLLVDDHRENLLSMEAVLEDLGLDLVKAGSGTEALKQVLGREFAAILLDVQMPGLDGFQAAALIRERDSCRNTPILFVTAVGKSDQLVSKGYGHGAVDYLFKPFVPGILRAKVKFFVELFQARETVRLQAKKLAEVNEELCRSNHELEEFASLASHDLQEPLRKATAFGTLLKERCSGKLDAAESQFLEYVIGAMGRMQSLIHAILELAKLGREVRKEPVDLEQLVDGVLLDLEIPIAEAKAQVSKEKLPRVPADPVLLARVFQNLLTNAIKSRGEREPKIHISAARNGANWVVSVKDNGIGIDPRRHEDIFRLLSRPDPKGGPGGTGIGLALCRRAVEHQGGRMWVESEKGQGADFRFTLPGA